MVTLLLAASLAAQAGDLEWRWAEAGTVRYQTQTLILVPNGYRFLSLNNLDARALQTAAAATLACTGKPQGKGAEVDCVVEDLALSGQAVATEQQKLDTIFAEHVETMKGAHLVLTVRPDGHIRTVDLLGVDKKYERGNDVHEQLRQLGRRMVAPLGVQTPKGGVVPDRAWRHKGQPAFFDLFVTMGEKGANYGTTGGSRYTYSVDGTGADGRLQLSGEGEANVTTVVERDAGGGLGINLRGGGVYRWDPQAGLLDYGEVTLSGIYNASSLNVGRQDAYTYAGQVARIHADGSIATAEP